MKYFFLNLAKSYLLISQAYYKVNKIIPAILYREKAKTEIAKFRKFHEGHTDIIYMEEYLKKNAA